MTTTEVTGTAFVPPGWKIEFAQADGLGSGPWRIAAMFDLLRIRHVGVPYWERADVEPPPGLARAVRGSTARFSATAPEATPPGRSSDGSDRASELVVCGDG